MQLMQLRKESLKKSGLPGFEPWPLRYRCSALTNWANKPTGNWELVIKLVRNIPGKDDYSRIIVALKFRQNIVEVFLFVISSIFAEYHQNSSKFDKICSNYVYWVLYMDTCQDQDQRRLGPHYHYVWRFQEKQIYCISTCFWLVLDLLVKNLSPILLSAKHFLPGVHAPLSFHLLSLLILTICMSPWFTYPY